MLAIHDQPDQFTQHMRKRLKTTSMGLGLVRLLLDAGRTKEARASLSSLQHGFRGKPCETRRLKACQSSPNSNISRRLGRLLSSVSPR
jgi:hypothetical protein